MSWYTEYLKTEHWQKVRAEALEFAGNRCQVCNGEDRLEVHHRTYERVHAEWPQDLTVLCSDCHGLYSARLVGPPETQPRLSKEERKKAQDEILARLAAYYKVTPERMREILTSSNPGRWNTIR